MIYQTSSYMVQAMLDVLPLLTVPAWAGWLVRDRYTHPDPWDF